MFWSGVCWEYFFDFNYHLSTSQAIAPHQSSRREETDCFTVAGETWDHRPVSVVGIMVEELAEVSETLSEGALPHVNNQNCLRLRWNTRWRSSWRRRGLSDNHIYDPCWCLHHDNRGSTHHAAARSFITTLCCQGLVDRGLITVRHCHPPLSPRVAFNVCVVVLAKRQRGYSSLFLFVCFVGWGWHWT